MVVQTGRLVSGQNWLLEGTHPEIVNQYTYRYLGFIFTTKLSLDCLIEDIAVRGKKKGAQALHANKSFHSVFDAQVQTTLLYGAEEWGLRKQQKVEGTHTFVCMKFLGVDLRRPNHIVYGVLGLFPLLINSS